jgi:plasmid stabilization system protein ParE
MFARFLKPAQAEVDEAVEYFDSQRNGLGDRFEEDLRNTVAALSAHPLTGRTISGRVRKFRLRTFRYNVIYVVDDEVAIIVAVAHHRRRPGYWHTRLSLLR